MVFHILIRQKCLILAQPSLFIIIFMSISQNNSGANYIITMLIKEKKNRKAKIFSILSLKKVVFEVKRSVVNDFKNDFANIASSIFF